MSCCWSACLLSIITAFARHATPVITSLIAWRREAYKKATVDDPPLRRRNCHFHLEDMCATLQTVTHGNGPTRAHPSPVNYAQSCAVVKLMCWNALDSQNSKGIIPTMLLESLVPLPAACQDRVNCSARKIALTGNPRAEALERWRTRRLVGS